VTDVTELAAEGYEPSRAQLRAWRAAPSGRAVVELAVRGAPAERVRAAAGTLTARHEILRTDLQRARGAAQPVAVIGAEPSWRVDVEDVEDRADGVRVVLTGPAQGLDGWSAASLARELGAAITGEPGDPDESAGQEPLQHADAAGWLQEIVADPEGAEGHAYWRDLAGRRGRAARLPYRDPGPHGGSGEDGPVPERVAVVLGAAAERALLACPGEEELRAVVLACWVVVLERVAGAGVTVGVALDGRGYPDLADAIGPYAGYVPVDACEAGGTLADLAARFAATLRSHARWQEYADWPPRDREDERGEVVPFALDVVDARSGYAAAGVQVAVTGWRTVVDRCELRLVVAWTATGLDVTLEHDPDRYAAADAAVLADQVGCALAATGRAAELPAARLPLLSDGQRRFVTRDVNPPAPAAPPGLLHELVGRRAAAQPDAPAVVAGGVVTSYRELAGLVASVTAALRSAGVGRCDLVGVALPGGRAAAVAHLAVLAAGATVVPLPCATAGLPSLRAVVTGDAATGDGGAGPARIVVDEEGAAHNVLAADAMNAASAESGDPADAAYLAPGPEGGWTAVDHGGAASAVTALAEAVGLTATDRVLAVAGPAERPWWIDLFGTLTAGGAVVYADVAGSPDGRDPTPWLRAAEAAGITVWSSAPALFGVAVEYVRESGRVPDGLRLALLSGERLAGAFTNRVRDVLPRVRVENLYGTGAAGPLSIRHLVVEDDSRRVTVPVGRPLASATCYVVDDDLEPCPVGITGRLAVGGVAVGTPVAGAPVGGDIRPDPFAAGPGRLLVTGDRARWRSDGELELVGDGAGRPDDTTGRLLTNPSVRAAVTVTEPYGEQVVAYVVGDAVGYLRTWLAGRVPEAELPDTVVGVPFLPLTANGRVAVGALAALAPTRPEYVAPGDELEADLVVAAAELLGVDRVGMLDNFFALGGHSLLLAQYSGRITERFGVEVQLQDLFEAATFEAVAHLVLDTRLAGLSEVEYAELTGDAAAPLGTRETEEKEA
jgi:non-ribosomal peptide synthetase component F